MCSTSFISKKRDAPFKGLPRGQRTGGRGAFEFPPRESKGRQKARSKSRGSQGASAQALIFHRLDGRWAIAPLCGQAGLRNPQRLPVPRVSGRKNGPANSRSERPFSRQPIEGRTGPLALLTERKTDLLKQFCLQQIRVAPSRPIWLSTTWGKVIFRVFLLAKMGTFLAPLLRS